MSIARERVVWLVSEGSPGHVSQSAGLAAALARKLPIRLERLECRPRLNGFVRSMVRVWMDMAGSPLPDWTLEAWLRLQAPGLPATPPDLVLSSGGKSVFAARSLAMKHGAPYVFLGERKPYRSEWFHTVFTPSSLEEGVNDVRIELIPTQITREDAETAAAAWRERPTGRLWTMVVGGASRSHQYADPDWEELARGMCAVARREGIRWLLTTSRRTGGEAEARLRSALAPDIMADAVWWGTKPEKRLKAYLGAAELAVVTQDSVTMVTEAVASGRAVVVVRPEQTRFPARSFMSGYLDRLESERRIARLKIPELASFRYEPTEFAVCQGDINAELAERLICRLGWGLNAS